MNVATRHTSLAEAVLATLAYFDAADMPLTPAELWMNLFKPNQNASFADVLHKLELLASKGSIMLTRGFAVRAGREALIDERIRREGHAIFKFRKLRRIVWLLRFVPFIRMVAACNTLAFDMARKEGDSDLFIVTKRNRLYLTRLLVTGLMHVIGVRRHGLRVADRVCLSFYVDEDGLDMSRFALAEGDPYLIQWTRRVVPLFSISGTYERFWKANVAWLASELREPLPYRTIPLRTVDDSLFSRLKRTALEYILFPFAPFLESFARSFERRHMRDAASRHIRLTHTGVVIDNHTLKFHEEDRRVFFREHMQEIYRQLNKQSV